MTKPASFGLFCVIAATHAVAQSEPPAFDARLARAVAQRLDPDAWARAECEQHPAIWSHRAWQALRDAFDRAEPRLAARPYLVALGACVLRSFGVPRGATVPGFVIEHLTDDALPAADRARLLYRLGSALVDLDPELRDLVLRSAYDDGPFEIRRAAVAVLRVAAASPAVLNTLLVAARHDDCAPFALAALAHVVQRAPAERRADYEPVALAELRALVENAERALAVRAAAQRAWVALAATDPEFDIDAELARWRDEPALADAGLEALAGIAPERVRARVEAALAADDERRIEVGLRAWFAGRYDAPELAKLAAAQAERLWRKDRSRLALRAGYRAVALLREVGR